MTLEELIACSEELLPNLATRAVQSNNLRRLTSTTIGDFKEAGIFRTHQPARYGGFELDFGALVKVSAKLAESCASSAWIASVIGSHHWVLGMFPPEAQNDVWGKDTDALVCSAYAHTKVKAVPQNGGYRLSGTWHYASGINYADWVILLAPIDEGGESPRTTTVLVPKTHFEILETWDAVGLRGTGTHDVHLTDAFVPSHRELSFEEANQGNAPGTKINQSHIYRLPFMGVGSFTVVGPCFGVAKSALEAYCTIMRERSGVISGTNLAEHKPLQLKVSESAAEIDAAWLLITADLDEVNSVTREEVSLDSIQCARFKRNVAFAARLCRNSVDRLLMAMGVPGQKFGNPVQRLALDMNALASHGLMSWEPNAISYGRKILGLDADKTYF